MGMIHDGLSYWRAESEGIDLLETTIVDLLDQRADELPTQEAIVYSCGLRPCQDNANREQPAMP